MSSAWSRRAALATWDVLSWTFAAALVLGVRHDFQVTEVQWEAVVRYWLFCSAATVIIGVASKFYRGRFLVGSFDEALGLAAQVSVVGILGVVCSPLISADLPRSISVLVPPIALLACAAGRWFYRAMRDRAAESDVADGGFTNAVIYGAGDAGRQVLQLLRKERDMRWRVVGFVDDNPGKRHLKILGVPVLGDGTRLAEIVDTVDAGAIILAIPSAPGRVVGGIQERVQATGADFYVLPRLGDLIGGRVQKAHIRKVEIADVLGRHQVSTDLQSIAGYITGRRVLITGAGGSIGSELARQAHHFGPAELILLDRDESALHSVQLSIYGHGLLDDPGTVLADIRDLDSLRLVFEQARPEVVFHAAALKHLPMLERYPLEGWKTNVLGTANMLALAEEFDVGRFVNISTDKAADASSVLGATKGLAERLTSWYATKTGRPYMSVRFGNVLGSRGSMLHTFTAQIEAGGPLTVTHPDVTRYFMTIPEACELVVQAGAIGHSGGVMVLEMGQPVSILEVAKRMIQLSGASDVEITFTGLRQGEKMHEVLFGDGEAPDATSHSMIRSVSVDPVDPSVIDTYLGPDSRPIDR